MGVSSSLSLPAGKMRRFMHRIRVPADIDSVTGIDSASECDPLEAGIGHAQAESIWQAVQALYRTGYYPAVMFCLRRQGRIVFNRSLGHVRGNAPLDEPDAVSYTHLRAHETGLDLVCRLLLEKNNTSDHTSTQQSHL